MTRSAELLDGVRARGRGPSDQLGALVGMLGEHLARPTDQARRRLVPGGGEEVDVGEHLGAAQAAHGSRPRPRTRPGAARSSGRRTGGSPATRCTPRSRWRRSLPPPYMSSTSGMPPSVSRRPSSMRSRIASWSCSGMPSSMPMVRMGICAPRSPMKSNPRRTDQRVEAAGAELPDLRLERVDLPGREDPRQQAAVEVVGRRVLEDDRARGHLHAALDQLEHGALGRDVGLPVERAPRRRPRSG